MGFLGTFSRLTLNGDRVHFEAGGGKKKLDYMLQTVADLSIKGPIAAIYMDRAYKLPVLMLMNNGKIERYSKLIANSRSDVMTGKGDFKFQQYDDYTTGLLREVPCGFDLEERMISQLDKDGNNPSKTSRSLVRVNGKSYEFPTYPRFLGGDIWMGDIDFDCDLRFA